MHMYMKRRIKNYYSSIEMFYFTYYIHKALPYNFIIVSLVRTIKKYQKNKYITNKVVV